MRAATEHVTTFASVSGRNALVEVSSRPSPIADKLGVPNDVLLLGLAALNAVTLIGVTITGRLARKRRVELASVNEKLRLVRTSVLHLCT